LIDPVFNVPHLTKPSQEAYQAAVNRPVTSGEHVGE
jgi:hypothetical protein